MTTSLAADSSPSSRIETVALQIAHRSAALAFFLLVAAIALASFHKDAQLLLPPAMILAGVAIILAVAIWVRLKLTSRRVREAVGIFAFSLLLVSAETTLMLLYRAGKL